MSLDIALYDALSAAGISPMLRGWLPQGHDLPCAVVRYITDRPLNGLNGEALLENQLLAIDCWAGDLESAEVLRDSVKSAVRNSSLTAIRKAIRQLHEPETNTFRFTIEYSVWG